MDSDKISTGQRDAIDSNTSSTRLKYVLTPTPIGKQLMSSALKEPVEVRQARPWYLSKSRFRVGLECPTKLFYSHKDEYPNQSLEDSFLEALAQGGYQVGELAKHYYPGGHDIKTLDYQEALEQTRALLEQDKVIIYEAAIAYRNLFIRVDILVKDGNHLDLVEVKAKSFDAEKDNFMKKKGRGLIKKWAPYLHDVAFQRFVTANGYPELEVDAYLMLTDKSATAGTDGLNTKFRIVKTGRNRKEIEVSDTLTADDLETRLLQTISIENELDFIFQEEMFGDRSFESHIAYLAAIYENGERIQGDLTSGCKKCEFRCPGEEEAEGKKSGYKECWTSVLGWADEDMEAPLVTDIWNFKSTDRLIAAQKLKLDELDEDDIGVKEDNLPGMSTSQRQWLQVEKAQANDKTYYLDREGLRAEMATWVYPLHFIDFETSAPALPFIAGMSPYEEIAFQFSHHVVYEDGRVEHAGQYLDTTIGHLPNFDFVKELKRQLDNDRGTIFRYHNHENTYLNKIFWQLKDKSGLPVDEIKQLGAFIKSITHSTQKSSVNWTGERDMIDLWQLVIRHYYDPITNGSTSIKQVLPAILHSSDYLKNKYSHPIYGARDGMPSLNLDTPMTWVQFDGDEIKDPYKLLPKLFDDMPDNIDELLSHENTLADGGAAMTAYARMQFVEMSDLERARLEQGLLNYCELDTLAMVMIFEAWREWVN